MSLISTSKINKLKAEKSDQWKRLGGGCYLVVAKAPIQSKRFVGKTRIGSPEGKLYPVPLGIWEKDFTNAADVLIKWEEMKRWGKENNCDLRKHGENFILDKSQKTLKEVFDLYLQWKSGHVTASTHTTQKNRLNQILRYLPDGILVSDLSGYEGTLLIKERVLDPSINRGVPYTAQKQRKLLNQVFEFAVADRLIYPEQIPIRLDKQFPFEKNIK